MTDTALLITGLRARAEDARKAQDWPTEAVYASAAREIERLAADAARLDWLENAIENMPDLSMLYAFDSDTEDDIGMIPQGWNIRCASVCAESLAFNAPTFRAVIDAATKGAA